MDRSYILDPHPIPAVDWPEYARRAHEQWVNLLAERGTREGKFQRFLELNPGFLPGVQGVREAFMNSAQDAVFAKPNLVGITTRQPDFVFTCSNSAQFVPVFVEIERPDKKWFRKDGTQRAELTQALHQIDEWRDSLQDTGNRGHFYDLYAWSDQDRKRAFQPHFMLVYGSRDEFDSNTRASRLRSQLEREDLTTMTFDRLALVNECSQTLTLRFRQENLMVVSLPPTFQLGPFAARVLLKADLNSTRRAIQRMEQVSAHRKTFLLERLPYWRGWARTELRRGPFIARGADRE